MKAKSAIPSDAAHRIRALLLRLDERSYSGGRTAMLTLRVVTADGDGSEIRFPDGSRSGTEWFYSGVTATVVHPLSDNTLNGFEISCHIDADPDNFRRDQADHSPRGPWGWRQGFSAVDLADADDAVEVARVLRHVRKALDQAERTSGPPVSFGWFAARTARALGASDLIHPARERWCANAEGNRTTDISDMASAIDHVIARWVESKQPAAMRALASGE